MARIKVHNILPSSDWVLLVLHFQPEKAEFLPSILYALREESISIPFLIQSVNRGGNYVFSLLVGKKDEEKVRAAFIEGLDLPPAEGVEIRENVALITLYGPHLGERPGIANRLLSCLSGDGVAIQAVSASINSCLLAIPQDSLPRALHSLDRIFEIPAK